MSRKAESPSWERNGPLVGYFIFFLTGCGMFGLAAYMHVIISNLGHLMAKFDIDAALILHQDISASCLMGIAGVILIISFMSCMKCFSENVCLLKTYCSMISILILCEIGAVAAILASENDIAKALTRGLIKDLDNYDIGSNATDAKSVTTEGWDELQSKWKCCGVTEFTDWVINTKLEETGSVPESCCKEPTEDCGLGMLTKQSPVDIYKEGCLMKLFDVIKGTQLGVSLTVSIFMTLHILIVVMACYLAHHQKQGKGKYEKIDK